MTPLSTSDLTDDASSANGIADLLRSNAAESERLRHVAPASIEAMENVGLWRLLTAASHGGAEAGLRAQVDSLLVVAAADPAAGWVQMVSNAHAWMVGNFPRRCQDEVFANGADCRIPGTLASQGRASRVEGGWSLDGRWQFASGVDHGDWLMIGAVADELPESPTPGLHMIVPKADIVVDDTWYTMGLRGTGSKDLVADAVFVPEHRAIPTKRLFDGESPFGEGGATFFNRLPVLVCLSVPLAAAVVGIAHGALDLHIERTATRREVYTGASKAKNPGAQMRVAESATELHLAQTLVQQAADRCDQVAASGVRLTIDERAELKWHAAYAVELTRRATDRIFAAAGAHGIYDDSLLQSRPSSSLTANTFKSPKPTRSSHMRVESVITGVLNSVGVKNRQNCRAPVSRQGYPTSDHTPLISEEPDKRQPKRPEISGPGSGLRCVLLVESQTRWLRAPGSGNLPVTPRSVKESPPGKVVGVSAEALSASRSRGRTHPHRSASSLQQASSKIKSRSAP